jgi:hypothetical protein
VTKKEVECLDGSLQVMLGETSLDREKALASVREVNTLQQTRIR